MAARILTIVILLATAGFLAYLNGIRMAGPTAAKELTPVIEQPITATSVPGQTAAPTAAIIATNVTKPSAAASTPVVVPTATWVWHPPGSIPVPVLLYHHVSDDKTSRYYVSRQNFAAQIAHLDRAGYTAIPISRLVEALIYGAELPRKPVVITFDDGYRDVYENAFPIMQRYNFVGNLYVITDQLGVKSYIGVDELHTLVNAGWEIGSHTRSHANLRLPGVKLVSEIEGSRQVLEDLLDIRVTTFSFPYGLTNRYITRLVEDAGYLAAVGLGQSSSHTENSRYYLSRVEIQGDADLVDFARLVAGPESGILPPPTDFMDP